MIDEPEALTEVMDPAVRLPEPPAAASVAGLQNELRRACHGLPAEHFLAAALAAIGDHFDGVFLVFAADLGDTRHDATWSFDGMVAHHALDRIVRGAMDVASASGRARMAPVTPGDPQSPTVLVAPVLDAAGVVGAAGLIVGPCPRQRAGQVLGSFEGITGFLATLLLETRPRVEGIVLPDAAADAVRDPLYVAHAIAARLQNRERLDLVAVGFVRGRRVRVRTVSGAATVRPNTPGVKRIQAAMEECLDRGAPLSAGGTSEDVDARLHAQWLRAVGGGTVACFPLLEENEVVAVVAVQSRRGELGAPRLARMQAETAPYARLIHVSRLASRGVLRHAAESTASGFARLLGARTWRGRLALIAVVAAAMFLAFGTLPYGFTVPCTVVPAEPRVVASPREGVLREVLARPGDRVVEGQVLARLATDDEELEVASLTAEVRRLGAALDRAWAEGEPGAAKVHAAHREAAEARLAHVELRLERSVIRAPAAGIVLAGDLRRRVGAKVSLGEALFQVSRGERVQVELRIPERRVWDVREARGAAFAPAARPTERLPVGGLRVHPASSVTGGENVFLARSESFVPPSGLTPGMEGVVRVEVGERGVLWILTHRVTDWLRLRFLL